MNSPSYSHVAISVPDLEAAESYYRALFEMEVVTREALTPDGDRQLPPESGWADARRAGVSLYMLALRRGDFVLALFDEAFPPLSEWTSGPRRPLFVGLQMEPDAMAALRARLGDGEVWDADSGGFRDRYGIVWQLSTSREFRGSGEIAGRWLDI